MRKEKKLLMGVLLFAITLAFSAPTAIVKAYSDTQINNASYQLTNATTLVMTVGGKKVTFALTQKSSGTPSNGVSPAAITPNKFTYKSGDLEGCPNVTENFFQGRPVSATAGTVGSIRQTVKPQIIVEPGDAKSNPKGPIKGSLLIGNNNAGETGCPPFDDGKHPVNIAVKSGVDTSGLTAGAAVDAGSGSPDDSKSCDVTLDSPLSWVLCPVIEGGSKFVDFVFTDIVKPLLAEVPISTAPDDRGYLAWKQFRLIGNIVLVGTMLAVVYAQVRGDR